MIIGVLSAMQKEHAQLTTLLGEAHTETDGNYSFTIGQLGQNTLILLQCGMGKVNAAVGATTLIRRYHPDAIISTGCAGGLDAKQKVMDVVVSTETAYHDVTIPGCEPGQMQGLPARFRAEEELVENAPLSSLDTQLSAGLIVTGDQFISDVAQLEKIKAVFPDALAVDMESAAIAQTCFLHAVPFVSFRIISDTPGADKHLQQYLNFWDEMADHSFAVTRRFLTALPSQFAKLPFAD
ncbi:MAG: 5'-methylthioadenosine/adenosylhomocysteine nucleosidase [Bacteroidaceae bacterium]|nr:5'-methylthioadenosine/adenosylhomocysteine nucleosidase [Bacteroidaceae bacterium]